MKREREREREMRWELPEEGHRKWRKWVRKIKTQEEIMYAYIEYKRRLN